MDSATNLCFRQSIQNMYKTVGLLFLKLYLEHSFLVKLPVSLDGYCRLNNFDYQSILQLPL